MLKEKYEKKKGFTLVELLMVMAIISLVVFIGVSSYGVVRKKMQLDISANTVESIIVEAREKTRAGYFDKASESELAATSYCFGFRVTTDGFIELLQTRYDRLRSKGEQCDITQDPDMLRTGRQDENIIIKSVKAFGNDISSGDNMEAFFSPPYADVEINNLAYNPQGAQEIRIVIGYKDSLLEEHPLDHREIVFDVLSGNVYAQRYEEPEPESIFN